MKTITKKTAKNGATLYYIDGKRASRADAMYWQRQNEIERKYLARIEAEKTFSDAMSEVNTSADAIDAAVEAEIEIVNNAAEENTKADEVNEEIAEINAADIKINVTDNGKVIEQIKVDINTAISIINRLNYRNDTFVYRHTTRDDNADIQYRHFDAYKANGESDAFAIIEIVVGGKLETVRFFNLFRDITVDLQIDYGNAPEETADYDDKRFSATISYAIKERDGYLLKTNHARFATAADAANHIIAFVAAHPDYIYQDGVIADWNTKTTKYDLTSADMLVAAEKIAKVEVNEETVDDNAVKAAFNNEFNAINEELNFLDAFNTKMTALFAAKAAQNLITAAVKEFDADYKVICEKRDETIRALRNINPDLYPDYSAKRDELLDELFAQWSKAVDAKKQAFNICLIRALIDKLSGNKAAVNETAKGDDDNTPPAEETVDADNDAPAEETADARIKIHPNGTVESVADKELCTLDACAEINQHAPEGWAITFDTAKNIFPVKFKGKQVATLDSLATQKFLSPEKFFEQFKPLVDKTFTPKQQFLADRYNELALLEEMREEIDDDAEQLRTLEEMIDQVKRDIAAEELTG